MNAPTRILRGRVWKFGDNIDTDIIAPADVISFGLGDANEQNMVKQAAFRDVREKFYEKVQPGDILVAGRNFGLGSHREPANKVLVSLGFSAVIAESIARLFFRNSVAIGFHAFSVPGIEVFVQEGETLEIDMQAWRVRNLDQGTDLKLDPYSELVQTIIESGGIIEVMKQRIASGLVPAE
ncbi:3-isopropylmalate dehydratase small subunit [Ancylobacter aquaticus]|uniref:3-isopropylmalate dehydratase small subunit n=1 Tax=Ancylobacter aquaticus TaxID=100 RepID=A0A4R1HH56_ANCAQ|nr:3-isopropylmalate dehydratase small subunit [Ancylobacter aquaticus]TCK19640.1 3-isopropylmalate dehydratase small subunit [Ancylobacter aquaticus]